MTYSEKLRDRRWIDRSAEVKDAAGWKCEDCGRRDVPLEAHHTAYITGRQPWEYDDDLLISVCDEHHEERQKYESAVYVQLGKLMRRIPLAELERETWTILEDISARQRAYHAALANSLMSSEHIQN